MPFRRYQLFLLSCLALAAAGAGYRTRSCNSGECQDGEEESGAILLQRRGQLLGKGQPVRGSPKEAIAKSVLGLAEPREEELPLNTTDIREAVSAIGFLKTHKTGSCTLTAILQRFAQAHGMNIGFPKDYHFWGWPGSFPGQENEQEPPPKYDLIANHAVFNSARWRDYLASNPVFASVVREPSSQAVSAYDYFSARSDDLASSFARHLEWVEALQSPSHKPLGISKSTARFLNPQAWDFGWYEYVGLTTEYDLNATMIKRWLTDLDKDFTNVVIMEHFDEGLALLARALHLEPREFAYVKKNAHTSSKTVPSDNEYSKLSKLYPVDRALYEHFKHVFQSRWANVPESARTHDLAQLRSASVALQAQCEHIETCPAAWALGDVSYTFYLYKLSQNETLTRRILHDILTDYDEYYASYLHDMDVLQNESE